MFKFKTLNLINYLGTCLSYSGNGGPRQVLGFSFGREPTNHKCEIILNFNIYDCPFLKEKECNPQKGEWERIWIQIFMKNIFCWLKANFLVEIYGIKHLYLILFGQMATAFFHSIILEFSFFLILNDNLYFYNFVLKKMQKVKILIFWSLIIDMITKKII